MSVTNPRITALHDALTKFGYDKCRVIDNRVITPFGYAVTVEFPADGFYYHLIVSGETIVTSYVNVAVLYLAGVCIEPDCGRPWSRISLGFFRCVFHNQVCEFCHAKIYPPGMDGLACSNCGHIPHP